MSQFGILPFNFGPACIGETIAYGAQAPDCINVMRWVSFMKAQGIQRVCCLLQNEQIDFVYSAHPIRQIYPIEFGIGNICWAAIPDYCLADRDLLLNTIIPFMKESVERNEKVVIHCAAGIGRTARILAAFLTQVRHQKVERALEGVIRVNGVYRQPLEGEGTYFNIQELKAMLVTKQNMRI